MPFQIVWQNQNQVVALQDANNRLEICPYLGFNAFRWVAGGHDLLYASPQFLQENRPMRGGFPVLFPFPNRIRDGVFSWEGKTYHLPIGDPAKKNAIHGFAYDKTFRIIDQGADATAAWITGELQASVDLPHVLPMWPTDRRMRVTYRLEDHVLRVTGQAHNPDTKPLPFGFGYHPYFALAPFGGDQAIITVGAARYWELVENLPTGKILEVDTQRDLRHGKAFASLQLDDVLTCLAPFADDQHDQLSMLATIQHPSGERLLTLWGSPDFREMVLFTPPHRQAICLEPYTCTTDAINLAGKGIDTGLRILPPGQSWQGTVELHFST